MRRLAAVLVAAGLIVWLAAPALSSKPFVPRAVEFEQALDTRGWSRGADGGWRSPVVAAPERFDLVGLQWRATSAAGDVVTRIRVRDAGGRWRRWTLMADDHAGGAGAEPVWAGGADAYQLRMEGVAAPPPSLRARFVNATGTATARDRLTTALRRNAHTLLAALAGDTARAQTSAPGSRGAPPIIPREQWGADQCPPRAAPVYGEVQLGFVHHTVNANAYSPHDTAAIVLSICRYHRNSNGWRDIGYNFLVDRYGQIFEGREGGIDQPVIGAQAQGYNGVSTGIANIGTYSQAPQTAEGVQATAELLAWKLSLHGAPVSGAVAVISAGGPSNRYRDGAAVTFERISGHRDADKTSCPGDALFAQLPEIRARAAELAPQFAVLPPPGGAVSLEAEDRTLDYPQPARLRGRATTADGSALVNAPISLQIASGRGFVTVGRTATGTDGVWSTDLQTQYSRSLRAVARLPAGALIGSPRLDVEVAPRLTLRTPKRVRARRSFTVRGAIGPRRPRVTLVIAREGSTGAMHTVARVPVKVKSGRFSTRVRLRRPALHRMQVVFAGDGRNRGTRSASVYVRAVRAR
ncbi:MAG TPA: N-acetylmuramoyl-L-alanine amidase [Solirubrobacteraceae bacterium]|nr:N-acetylmuramoyl-L-alanine amidase [Solirubrobacteraceae bacterium]